MITYRASGDRGYADHGWLRSHHSFSFASYQDPRFMGFGNLRVINEDRIAAGTGFGTHGHRDMEIVSVVLSGALGHRDSLGHGSTILPGEVQRMSAGSGIQHSEHNHSTREETHFLQIWFLPDESGGVAGYEQARFDPVQREGRLQTLVSRDGREGSLRMGADASLMAGVFTAGQVLRRELDPTRLCYVHLVKGRLSVNDQSLQAGDALMMEHETELRIADGSAAEVLVFDLALRGTRPAPRG
jgi:redox-sensitive bicupin YhaK (pirin superfamily)